MKMFISFKLEAITDASESDQKKTIKVVLSFLEKREKNGLQEIVVVSVKSTVEVDKKLIGKEVICEVTQTIIPSSFGKPNIYYKASSVKPLMAQ